MTLWNNKEETESFAYSGAHKEVMKISSKIAKEIRLSTYESNQLPNWKTAIKRLETGKVITF